MSEQDKEQKTEEPTHKRLEEARKRGQVAMSREIGSFFILMVFAVTLTSFLPGMLKDTLHLLKPLLEHADGLIVDRAGLGHIFIKLILGAGALLAVPLVLTMAAAIAASMLQNGPMLTTDPITPKLEKISIRKGLSRMFSVRAVVEFTKGLFKIGIVGVVCYLAVKSQMNHLRQLPDDDTMAMLIFLLSLVTRIMIGVCVAMFFIALLDYLYQRHDYMKNLRMTKQEVRDEYKQQEGDPHIKQRLKQIRAERARNRMMADVPKSDVVITNPTHYAVALKYDTETMQAPKVTAKGQDYLALTMRKIAEEYDVPIVENPPLARSLHASVEVDQEIPIDMYKAVAEVISYVYQLKGKMPGR